MNLLKFDREKEHIVFESKNGNIISIIEKDGCIIVYNYDTEKEIYIN